MICFRDMTFCSAACNTAICMRHPEQEKKMREKPSHLKDLPTMWGDLSEDCPMYEKVEEK